MSINSHYVKTRQLLMHKNIFFEPCFQFLATPYDGVLGLGRVGLSANGITPVFERLLSSAAVSEPLIGISFDRNPLLVSSSGELTWGGINSDKFVGNFPEDFQNFQSTSDDFWTVNLSNISSSDSAFQISCPESGCLGRVSTGSAFITGPREQVRQINEHFGAVESIDGYWFLFCDLVDQLPSIKIFLDNLPFTLDHQDFVINANYDNRDYCVSAFREERNTNPEIDRPLHEANQWNLGTSFLAKYYTVLDYETNSVFFGQKNK
ncbi:unnamed protein product [Oikopleura dioica]|uniref:Peptidase A1 domain-containing protein n=1 Tax=Oikopleura dioica TaxID=34765 RepID=E4YFH4_OIKDI|nr:unnamed protein product [Oikopleura dioica]